MALENLEGRTPAELAALAKLAQHLEVPNDVFLDRFVGWLRQIPDVLMQGRDTSIPEVNPSDKPES